MSLDNDILASLRETFLEEFEELIESIENCFLRWEKSPESRDLINEIFRYFHNIKGSSKTVDLLDLSHFAHKAEDLLAKIRNGEKSLNSQIVDELLKSTDLMSRAREDIANGNIHQTYLAEHAEVLKSLLEGKDIGEEGPAVYQDPPAKEDLGFGLFDDEPSEPAPVSAVATAQPPQPAAEKIQQPQKQVPPQQMSDSSRRMMEESIKVPLGRVSQILDLFVEQVILQSSLEHVVEQQEIDVAFLQRTIGQLKKITQDLQYTMISLRMVPLTSVFNRMERTIRDTAKQTGKDIEFVKIGANNELDKTIADALVDPLMHMVRNAVDHGVESPADRIAAGKPGIGTVILGAERKGGFFEIRLQDDGKGLDPEKLIATAIKKGVIGPQVKLTDREAYELIFAGGFSTVAQATEISGRGVGMDVVKQMIMDLKGTVEIESQVGRGTTFLIKVPLSLAMFQGTIVDVDGQNYIIPNSDFNDVINIKSGHRRQVAGSREVVRIGERVLKVIDLRQYLSTTGHGGDGEGEQLSLVVRREGHEYALLVSDVLAQEQIVLKKLGKETKKIKGCSGGTILGDGKVALVVDVNQLISDYDGLGRRLAS